MSTLKINAIHFRLLTQYEIKCKNCQKSYIGETGRLFRTRLKEHKTESDKVEEKFLVSELDV